MFRRFYLLYVIKYIILPENLKNRLSDAYDT